MELVEMSMASMLSRSAKARSLRLSVVALVALSSVPARTEPREVGIVLPAHGPVPDAHNALWLADMGRLAVRVRSAMPFAQVEAIAVRDDAPAAVRAAATADLRALVTRSSSGDRQGVLIVPLLLSSSGIEAGIGKRLEGLDYTMAAQGIMPDDRVRQWVLDAAGISR